MSAILALDQGTTSSRAIVFGHNGRPLAIAQKEFPQILPQPGHVEHNAEEIWSTQLETARAAIEKAGLAASDIAAIGITNQRETTVLWDRDTGQAIDNAIVWQSRVTADICDQLRSDGLEQTIREKTGLVVDAYFSGTKIKYLLDKHSELRQRAARGEVLFGTVDSFLIWRLTGRHVTDPSNACRTMIFNIHQQDWDQELLDALDIPREMLPEVVDSSQHIAETDPKWFGESIPVTGIAGDQQAATFGQACFEPGEAKNTYGTGCFMLLNTGDQPVTSQNRLLTTIGWRINGQTTYCLEGSVFVAGAIVQWLRDGLGIIENSEDVEQLAASVDDTQGVIVVPALTGLGAPYWDPHARGAILGLSRGATAAHIARAAVESMAFQSKDVLEAMQRDAGCDLRVLRVDGGAAANDDMLQFQADILDVPVHRSVVSETTALGAAYLAGLAVGYWDNLDQIRDNWALDKEFVPDMNDQLRQQRYKQWLQGVERSRNWA